jgi:hypothetical protein
MTFYFYSKFESGHRKEYIEFCNLKLNGTRINKRWHFFCKEPLLFLMVEECFILYLFISLVRSSAGLKTSGLLFRGKECVTSDSRKMKLKFFLLKILKIFSLIRTISIVPFNLYPDLEKICSGWIYDFQFVDRDYFESKTKKEEVDRYISIILDKAKGKKIISTLGRQDTDKGFEYFTNLHSEYLTGNSELFFISAGKIDPLLKDFEDKLLGDNVMIFNDFISNSLMLALYIISDYIWIYYSPGYDQSSGILGRAFQFNKKVIVRQGSVVDQISEMLGMKKIALNLGISNEISFSPEIDIQQNGFSECEYEDLVLSDPLYIIFEN